MRALLSWLRATVLVVLARPAIAGPPFVSDDPEPTEYRHFEIFNNGTNTRDGTGGETGVDFNYGAAPDLQLTATCPRALIDLQPVEQIFGLSNIELTAKCRRLHQDTFGLDLAVFPRVFLPSGRGLEGRMVRARRRWMRIQCNSRGRFLFGSCCSDLSADAQAPDWR